RAL
ncbi:lateral flagellar MotY-like domain protein, partial [Vibrio parahaemolyticus V-223/04]